MVTTMQLVLRFVLYGTVLFETGIIIWLTWQLEKTGTEVTRALRMAKNLQRIAEESQALAKRAVTAQEGLLYDYKAAPTRSAAAPNTPVPSSSPPVVTPSGPTQGGAIHAVRRGIRL